MLKIKRKYSRKSSTSKIEGYLKAVEYYRRLSIQDQEELLKKTPTPVVVWFINETEYFGARPNKKEAEEIGRKIRKLPLTIHPRFQTKSHKMQQEMQMNKASKKEVKHKNYPAFGQILASLNFPQQNCMSPTTSSHCLTTIRQDEHFLSSTLSIAFNSAKRCLANQSQWVHKVLSTKMRSRQTLFFEEEPDYIIGNIQIEHKQMENDKLSGQTLRQSYSYDYSYGQTSDYSYDYTTQDLLLQDLKKLPIDVIISLLEASLPKKRSLPFIVNESSNIIVDPVDYVFHLKQEQLEYLQYMEDQQKRLEDSSLRAPVSQADKDDPPCQVCYDGQSTLDNLIVFCSNCGITMHQQCVGLEVVPEGNWLCDLCKDVGSLGIYLPCPLCSIKGGAMKNTKIGIATQIFQQLNPHFDKFLTQCQTNYFRKTQNQKGVYNFYDPESYPQPAVSPSPITIWAHLTCLSWFPQFMQIDEERFIKKCQICKLVRGATAKCGQLGCGAWVHAQCAKRKKRLIGPCKPGEISAFNYYCKEHVPFLPLMQVEQRKKLYRGDIIRFCKSVQSFYNNTKSLEGFNYHIYTNFPTSKIRIAQKMNSVLSIKPERDIKNDKEHIILSYGLNPELKDINLPLDQIQQSQPKDKVEKQIKNDQIYKQISVQNKQQQYLQISPAKMNATPWRMRPKIGNAVTIPQISVKENNSSPPKTEIVKKQIQRQPRKLNKPMNRHKLRSQSRTKSKNIKPIYGSLSIRKLKSPKKLKIQKSIHKASAISILPQQNLYCICRKPYSPQSNMIECYQCSNWFDFKCIGFKGSVEDAEGLDFVCMACLKKKEFRVQKMMMNRMRLYFQQQSAYEQLLFERKPNINIKKSTSKKTLAKRSHEAKSSSTDIGKNEVRRSKRVISRNS